MINEHFYQGFEKRASVSVMEKQALIGALFSAARFAAKPLLAAGRGLFGKGVMGGVTAALTIPDIYRDASKGARAYGEGARKGFNLAQQSVGVGG